MKSKKFIQTPYFGSVKRLQRTVRIFLGQYCFRIGKNRRCLRCPRICEWSPPSRQASICASISTQRLSRSSSQCAIFSPYRQPLSRSGASARSQGSSGDRLGLREILQPTKRPRLHTNKECNSTHYQLIYFVLVKWSEFSRLASFFSAPNDPASLNLADLLLPRRGAFPKATMKASAAAKYNPAQTPMTARFISVEALKSGQGFEAERERAQPLPRRRENGVADSGS